MRYFKQKGQQKYKYCVVSTEEIVDYCLTVLKRNPRYDDLNPHLRVVKTGQPPWVEIDYEEYLWEKRVY